MRKSHNLQNSQVLPSSDLLLTFDVTRTTVSVEVTILSHSNLNTPIITGRTSFVSDRV